jgi:hypothetical protein
MSPEEQADNIFWAFSKNAEFTQEQVVNCCNTTIDIIIRSEPEPLMRVYWDYVKDLIYLRTKK